MSDAYRLIECRALAKLSLTMTQKKALHASLDENLKHPAAAIQSQAAVALCAFCTAYISKASSEALARTTIKHLQVSLCIPSALRSQVSLGASVAAGATGKVVPMLHGRPCKFVIPSQALVLLCCGLEF